MDESFLSDLGYCDRVGSAAGGACQPSDGLGNARNSSFAGPLAEMERYRDPVAGFRVGICGRLAATDRRSRCVWRVAIGELRTEGRPRRVAHLETSCCPMSEHSRGGPTSPRLRRSIGAPQRARRDHAAALVHRGRIPRGLSPAADRVGHPGQEWIRLRIPMRPNGKTGWVRRQDLGEFHLTHMQITVNRARLRMYVYDDGHRIWSAPSRSASPPPQPHPGTSGSGNASRSSDRNSGYWPYAFGTSDYSTLTDSPGGASSASTAPTTSPRHPRTRLPRLHPPPRHRRRLARPPRGLGTPVRVL